MASWSTFSYRRTKFVNCVATADSASTGAGKLPSQGFKTEKSFHRKLFVDGRSRPENESRLPHHVVHGDDGFKELLGWDLHPSHLATPVLAGSARRQHAIDLNKKEHVGETAAAFLDRLAMSNQQLWLLFGPKDHSLSK